MYVPVTTKARLRVWRKKASDLPSIFRLPTDDSFGVRKLMTGFEVFFQNEASEARQAGGKRREGPLWASLGYVGNAPYRCPHILTCP